MKREEVDRIVTSLEYLVLVMLSLYFYRLIGLLIVFGAFLVTSLLKANFMYGEKGVSYKVTNIALFILAITVPILVVTQIQGIEKQVCSVILYIVSGGFNIRNDVMTITPVEKGGD